MAMSEVFNLDFKFGGNAEFLVKLESLLQRIDSRFDSFEDDVKESTQATDKMADAVDDLNDSFKEGVGAMSSFGEKLKDIAQYYLSFQAIRMGAERVWSFGRESMEIFSTQERAENQLKGVMKNRGNLDQFQTIKDYAAEIQGRSIYGDEAMIRGAGELATYVKGTQSLKSMMDLLTDYAAGMTGGGEVSPEQMESLATGLGMAYDGNYMAMRRKGFDTSKLEALDALAENGGVWGAKEKKKYGDVLDADLLRQARAAGGVTEQMRVDAIKESLKDWQGLSDAVNDLDSSAIIRFNNAIGDLRENLGKRLYPVFNGFVAAIEDKMPMIEVLFDRLGDMFTTMSDSFATHLDSIFEIGSHLADILPEIVEFGFELLQVADDVIFKFVGFKEAILAVVAAMAVHKVLGFKAQIISVGIEMKKTALEFGKAAVSMKKAQFSLKEIGMTMGSLGRVKLNEALKGATAQALLFTAAMWGLEKVFEAGKTALELYSQKKKEAEFKQNEAEKNAAYDKMMNARSAWKNSSPGINDRKAYGKYQDAVRDYMEWTGGALPSYIKDEMFNMKFNDSNNAAKQAQKLARESGKTEIHQTFNNTNIEQKVNVAADVEKIGMLLNFSVRAAIEQAMRQNKNQVAVGAI